MKKQLYLLVGLSMALGMTAVAGTTKDATNFKKELETYIYPLSANQSPCYDTGTNPLDICIDVQTY